MVNQWGRDGNFSSSGTRSSGAGAIVIAALVALLLGAGGGYTGARILGGAATSDLQLREQRIADLEKQVSDLKFATSGDADQENALREKVAELTKANESLKGQIDENENRAGADAQAEIAALKKTIEEAGDSRVALNRARRSLQVAELQIIELEKDLKTQRAEMDKLRKSVTDAATQGDAGNKALTDQIQALETALAESRRQAADAVDLRKQLASVSDDLAQKTSDLSTARAAVKRVERETDKAKAELAKVRKDLATALAASKDKGGQSEALQKELAAIEEQLAIRDGDVSRLNTRLTQMKRDLDEADRKARTAVDERTAMGRDLSAARSEREKLEGEVAMLNQTIQGLKRDIDELKATQREDTSQPDVTTENDDATVTRRDADDVRNALEDMPGFNRLKPDKQLELAQRLEDGECAADALKTTLGRVPAIALRNLIRDLGSKC